MVKFVCLTCWNKKDDSEINWWEDKPCCSRCYDKYERLDKHES